MEETEGTERTALHRDAEKRDNLMEAGVPNHVWSSEEIVALPG